MKIEEIYCYDSDDEVSRGFDSDDLQYSLKYTQNWYTAMSRLFAPEKTHVPQFRNNFFKKKYSLWVCMKCSTEFTKPHYMQKHLSYSCGKKRRFRCSYCDQQFVQKKAITRHFQEEHPDKKIKYVNYKKKKC